MKKEGGGEIGQQLFKGGRGVLRLREKNIQNVLNHKKKGC